MPNDPSEVFLRQLIDGDPSVGILAEAPTQHRKRVATALMMEQESAQEVGMLGYQARLLVQCSLPYRQLPATHWTRTNGAVRFAIVADPEYGLPYGPYPRLILTWVATEAVRKQSRRIDLHLSLNALMAQLGIASHANGEKRQRFKDQILRLFTATISSTQWEEPNPDHAEHPRAVHYRREQMLLADDMELWWDPYQPSQPYQAASFLTLSERFYTDVTAHPVPIDLRAITALKGSALALDIYSWLVYRLSYLKKPTKIPWELLQMQFGGEYAETKQGRYEFKRKFQVQLAEVLRLYSEAKVTADSQGLTLKPSRLAIDRKFFDP